jgi:NTE family protein
LSTDNRFFLGGFLNLSGFQSRDLSGEYVGLGQLVYLYELRGASSAFDTPLYLGGSLEAGNTWERSDDISFESLIPAGSVFLGADTFLGPFYLGAGIAESGRSAFYMFLGVPFQ